MTLTDHTDMQEIEVFECGTVMRLNQMNMHEIEVLEGGTAMTLIDHMDTH